MTARPGLFVANGSAGVAAPQDTRLALAGALVGEPGVLAGTGGNVTGSSSGPNMKYVVPASVFATTRGVLATDGTYLWANDGNITVDTLTPAPSSGTRYDLIWARALNANDGFGDANSTPVLGFTVGTASGSPVKPYASVPAGAYVLAESLVGTSIANASLATLTQVATSVVARGGLLPVADATARNAVAGTYDGFGVYRRDTDNIEVKDGGGNWDIFQSAQSMFSLLATPVAGTYDATKPIKIVMDRFEVASDAGARVGISTPVGTTCVLFAVVQGVYRTTPHVIRPYFVIRLDSGTSVSAVSFEVGDQSGPRVSVFCGGTYAMIVQ